jgi:hypothetical protein
LFQSPEQCCRIRPDYLGVIEAQVAVLERPELLRSLFHGAMQVYLIRFLNVPPARLPSEGDDRLDDLPPLP